MASSCLIIFFLLSLFQLPDSRMEILNRIIYLILFACIISISTYFLVNWPSLDSFIANINNDLNSQATSLNLNVDDFTSTFSIKAQINSANLDNYTVKTNVTPLQQTVIGLSTQQNSS